MSEPTKELELHEVMQHMVRVVDTLNRDRSFRLAMKAQAALQALSDLKHELDNQRYTGWWTTPPTDWDHGWKEEE